MVQARDEIRRVPRRGKRAADFAGKFRRAAFIGINADDPVVLEQRQRVIAKFSEAFKFYVHVTRAELRADRRRIVRAERVHDDHFIRPQNRRQHLPKVGRFLIGNDVKADGFGHKSDAKILSATNGSRTVSEQNADWQKGPGKSKAFRHEAAPQPGPFVRRHIGPNAAEARETLASIGFKNLDELIAAAPTSIRPGPGQ
jgi:hypothetical protein